MNSGTNFFVAGWFCDQQKNILSVEDEYNGNINIKAPGGRSDAYAFYDQKYLETIEGLLVKAFFSLKEIDQIIKRESRFNKSPEERVLVAEYLEESAYYAYDFSYSSHDFRLNRDSGRRDYKRTFYDIKKLIERNPDPDANELKEVIEIAPLPGFKSSDRDVINPRKAIPAKEAYEMVFYSHKDPLKKWMGRRAAAGDKLLTDIIWGLDNRNTRV